MQLPIDLIVGRRAGPLEPGIDLALGASHRVVRVLRAEREQVRDVGHGEPPMNGRAVRRARGRRRLGDADDRAGG